MVLNVWGANVRDSAQMLLRARDSTAGCVLHVFYKASGFYRSLTVVHSSISVSKHARVWHAGLTVTAMAVRPRRRLQRGIASIARVREQAIMGSRTAHIMTAAWKAFDSRYIGGGKCRSVPAL